MDVATVVGLRDRAIIAVMTYAFARVGAVNRLFLSNFTTGAITVTPTLVNGVNTGGYGTIATAGGAGAVPRSGQAILRITF